MEAVIFIGIQATGKSEFYKQQFYKSHIRINLDMLRTRNRERILLTACLEAKQPFVIDNTNVQIDDRRQYLIAAQQAGFKKIGYYFQSQVDASIQRNNQRSGKENIPVRAILGTYHKLELPALEEGFDELYYVRIAEQNKFVVEEYQNEI